MIPMTTCEFCSSESTVKIIEQNENKLERCEPCFFKEDRDLIFKKTIIYKSSAVEKWLFPNDKPREEKCILLHQNNKETIKHWSGCIPDKCYWLNEFTKDERYDR